MPAFSSLMPACLSVTVTEALVLHPLLEDRGRITESIRIPVPADRMKQKCFQITIIIVLLILLKMTWVTAALVGVQQRVEKMSGNFSVPRRVVSLNLVLLKNVLIFFMFRLNRLSQRIVCVVRSVFVV